jgi:hypothetical protein
VARAPMPLMPRDFAVVDRARNQRKNQGTKYEEKNCACAA